MDAFRNWLFEDPATRVPQTLTILAVLFVLPLVGFAVYLWRMAASVDEGGEFPPKGYRFVRPGPTMRGADAIGQAHRLRAFAMFLVVAAVGFVIVLWRFAVLIT